MAQGSCHLVRHVTRDSAMQWGAGRGSLCPAPVITYARGAVA